MANTTNKLRVVYGDNVLGLHGAGFDYIFDYGRGGLNSLVIDGHEWLYREPQPAFWRASTSNDRGNGFAVKSAQWFAADTFTHATGVAVAVNGAPIPLPIAPVNNQYSDNETAELVTVTFTYETVTVPTTTVTVAYSVVPDGAITVRVHYQGNAALPELPVFGLRLLMPTTATGFDYAGLSGETYPDRMAGGVKAVYHVDGLPVTPYLVPQDCGVHMQTDWVRIERETTQNNVDLHPGLYRLTVRNVDGPFAFSCLPYTPAEIENATHIEELPLARRTVLTIMGAVRGVGGIDSWGADVDSEYHISAAQDLDFAFMVKP